MQIIGALESLLTALTGSSVVGVFSLASAKSPAAVHSRPIFIRRVKL